MELFEFINILFTNSLEFSKITSGEKRKHFFLCQRRFAIQFPQQANALQSLKINQNAVIDFWQEYLRKTYKGYMPKWIYTKGEKKTQEVKEKKSNVSDEVINEYCKWNKIDRKTIKDALEFYNSLMIAELKTFEKIIKQK